MHDCANSARKSGRQRNGPDTAVFLTITSGNSAGDVLVNPAIRHDILDFELLSFHRRDIVKCCVLKTFGTRCTGLFLLFIIPASEARFWDNRLSRFGA